jgi:hypothetical protein
MDSTMALLSRNRLLESHVIRKAVKRGSEGGDWKSDVPKHVLLAGRLPYFQVRF